MSVFMNSTRTRSGIASSSARMGRTGTNATLGMPYFRFSAPGCAHHLPGSGWRRDDDAPLLNDVMLAKPGESLMAAVITWMVACDRLMRIAVCKIGSTAMTAVVVRFGGRGGSLCEPMFTHTADTPGANSNVDDGAAASTDAAVTNRGARSAGPPRDALARPAAYAAPAATLTQNTTTPTDTPRLAASRLRDIARNTVAPLAVRRRWRRYGLGIKLKCGALFSKGSNEQSPATRS